jgi:hypothetical protein
VTAISRRRTEEKVSLVAKVKDKAGGLYEQARAKYADNDAMQKVGRQAGEAAQKAGKQASEAASQATDRLKDLAAKTTSAVKDARGKGTDER